MSEEASDPSYDNDFGAASAASAVKASSTGTSSVQANSTSASASKSTTTSNAGNIHTASLYVTAAAGIAAWLLI
jgi:hypothetical protein